MKWMNTIRGIKIRSIGIRGMLVHCTRITKRAFNYFFIFTLLVLGSCSSSKKVYKIGVDPTWFPLEIANKEPYILAFSHELLQKIGHLKSCEFQRIAFSWDDLLDAVGKEQCQAILSSLEPYVFNKEKDQFSENFLNTGPVLVMRDTAKKSEVDHLYEKEIAVFSQNDEQILMQKYPDALPRTYDSLPMALVDLSTGAIDGVLMDYLRALSYVTDIYAGQLKIASMPLNHSGIKLVTTQGQQKHLVRLFNEGLKELKQSGEYEALLKKWKLG